MKLDRQQRLDYYKLIVPITKDWYAENDPRFKDKKDRSSIFRLLLRSEEGYDFAIEVFEKQNELIREKERKDNRLKEILEGKSLAKLEPIVYKTTESGRQEVVLEKIPDEQIHPSILSQLKDIRF